MKKFILLPAVFACLTLLSCNNQPSDQTSSADKTPAATNDGGQSNVKDEVSAKNIVGVAVSSADHTTLVTAVKAAGLVDELSNAGPFTVFAPTNEAFNKLPAGTVEGLLKPEKKDDLSNILEYHVSVGVFKPEMLQDGQVIGQVNGDNITVTKKDGKILLNGTATIVASIPASNGIVHVIDGVLLPPAKK